MTYSVLAAELLSLLKNYLFMNMKFLFVFVFATVMIGCSYNPTTVLKHELVVSPMSLTFPSGVSVQHLSITHTCTCPFSWTVNPLDLSLVLPSPRGNWDSTNAWIVIDRSKLTVDTLHSSLQITSNGYGTDTVQVIVIR
jgi:hypothetical protein